jgi:hypothetical protein
VRLGKGPALILYRQLLAADRGADGFGFLDCPGA